MTRLTYEINYFKHLLEHLQRFKQGKELSDYEQGYINCLQEVVAVLESEGEL